jgi:DNA-binding transcriptional LysR family regulator
LITNLRQLDLNLLLVFDALMQEGNLTRAAERLHLSQSTVSNALARLRQQLGEELFLRTARGMTPTARAQALYVPVRQALGLLQSGLGPTAAFNPQTPHTFSLSLNDYAQAALLPRLQAHLAHIAAQVELQVQVDDADSLVQRLTSGTLDLAIDYLHFDCAELHYAPLREEPLVAIGRAGHPAFVGGLTLEGYQQARHISVTPGPDAVRRWRSCWARPKCGGTQRCTCPTTCQSLPSSPKQTCSALCLHAWLRRLRPCMPCRARHCRLICRRYRSA